MPDDLASQVGWMKEISGSLGMRVCELDGYEADDIIGTLAAAGFGGRHGDPDRDRRQGHAAAGRSAAPA